MIEFYKYQGTGNDFILVDNRSKSFTGAKVAFVQKWCSRRFGVGSDGLIFIEQATDADFLMDFYNPDGSQSFCGNGSRCAVRFAQFLGVLKSNSISFRAIDGLHTAEINADTIRIKMKDVSEVEMIGEDYTIHTGSPHYISYETKNLRDIVLFGKSIRYSDSYKENGINVNLVEEISDNHIRIRTYERGVEDETFSCGTGATACALSYALKNELSNGTVVVDVKGGTLKIEFEQLDVYPTGGHRFKNIWLDGPAEFVFKGSINNNPI